MPRPDNLKESLASLEPYYSEAYRMAERVDDIYEQRFERLFNFEYDVPIHRSSTGSDIVDTFRNQMRTDEPTVRFKAAGPSRTAEEAASLMMRWGRGMLDKERARARIDPNLQCGFDLLLRGAACKKIVVDMGSVPIEPAGPRDTEAHREWEAAIADHWPYVTRAIDPLNVFPSPGDARPLQFVFERQRRTAADMWASYPGWRDLKAATLDTKDKNNPARPVEWIEYWCAPIYANGKLVETGYYIVEADGDRVIDKINPFGFVPYIYEYSGIGRSSADNDPVHMMVGILHKKTGEIEAEVKLKTALSAQAMMHVFPTLLTVEDPKKVAKQFSVGPGRIVQHPPGNPPVFMEHPQPNENILRFLAEIKGSLASLHNQALLGERPEGVDFGIHQAQLTGQALTQIRHIRSTLNLIGSQTLDMMAKMASVLNLTMTVEGTGEKAEKSRLVHGSDFSHFNFEVDFKVIDPAENDRMLLVGENMRRAGDISRRTFHRVYAPHVVEDPDEEEAAIWTERVLEQMLASGAMAQIVLSEAGQEEILERASAGVDMAKEAIQGGSLARQTEQMAGTPGVLTEPQQTAEQIAQAAGGP